MKVFLKPNFLELSIKSGRPRSIGTLVDGTGQVSDLYLDPASRTGLAGYLRLNARPPRPKLSWWRKLLNRWNEWRCDPFLACRRHGRCWTHSEWADDE